MNDPQSRAPNRIEITEAQRAEVLRAMNKPRWRWRVFSEFARTIIYMVVLFLLIRTFFVEAFKIPSGSMERTILVGDFLLVNKLAYGAAVPFTDWHLPAIEQPQRGDVIVFKWPKDPSQNYVKRLIGLPGDTVAMRDGQVWLDGHALDERYVIHTQTAADQSGEEFRWQRHYLVRQAEASEGYHPSRNNWGPLVVPPQDYFVLGDNRDNSYDSRYWGFVPDSLLEGTPLIVYYSYNRDTDRPLPWLTNIRWGRLGDRIR
ncbi:MAG TPA: signal peptidase I [Gemmatimonadaceae bacterium]|nr:signal peptidase I [Gemmatimonadaceae bacterium]